MTDSNLKLSVGEKIGYSLGDLSANLIFQTLMTFLAFFYTDVYKIPPAAASGIIFAGGMAGAFFNPIMGMIADRTSTRWGKFRPWILWTAVPFGVMAILAFSTPDFSEKGKVAYALITYFILVLVYSANNLPLVLILGDGDKTKGFESTMAIFAGVGVVFFIITFLTTRERVIPKPEQKSSIKEDLGDLVRNKPWIAMLVLTVVILLPWLSREEPMFTKMGMHGFQWPEDAPTSGFSLFLSAPCLLVFVFYGP